MEKRKTETAMPIKTCPQCNSQFTTKHKHTIHCSHKCNGLARRTHDFNKKCQLCGKEYASRHKESKYCSKDCQSEDNKKGLIVNCFVCSKEMHRPIHRLKSQDKHFCSRLCYLEDHKHSIVTVKCHECNKDINRPSFSLHKGSKKYYCDNNCRSQRDMALKCKVCSVEFCSIQYRKSNTKNGFLILRPFRNTCSDKCLIEFYKTDEQRKDKISFAFSGEKHPNYVNGASHNGRIRKTDLKENFGNRDKRELLEKFDNKCFKCGGVDYLSVDHHVPFSRGGRLTFTNSVILCRSCNSSKNAKMPSEFYSNKELKKLKALGIDQQSIFNY